MQECFEGIRIKKHFVQKQLYVVKFTTLFLVIGWGYQPKCLQAGLYLVFKTILASLP